MAELSENGLRRGPFWLLDAAVAVLVLLGTAALLLAWIIEVRVPERARGLATAPAARTLPATAEADPTAGWMSKGAVMAAISGVPAPIGSGLPNVKAIQVEPTQIFAVLARLEVEGMDNPAWDELTVDEQQSYANEVASSIRAALPDLTVPAGYSTAYVRVGIWGWHRVPGATEDLAERYCRTRALSAGADYSECYLPEVTAMVEIGSG